MAQDAPGYPLRTEEVLQYQYYRDKRNRDTNLPWPDKNVWICRLRKSTNGLNWVLEIVVIKQGRLSTATDNDSTGGSSLTGEGKQSGPEREEEFLTKIHYSFQICIKYTTHFKFALNTLLILNLHYVVGFVKVASWICQSWYGSTRICQNWYMDF